MFQLVTVAVLCMCSLQLAAGATIDYSRCEWIYGDSGNTEWCQQGWVGVGACGNKGQPRCGASDRAFAIYCCAISDGSTWGECDTEYGHQGDYVECTFGTQVFATCGSRDISKCDYDGGRYCVTNECCTSSLSVTEDCEWQHTDSQGANLICDSFSGGESVMTGRCGSETIGACSGQVHAIECCRINT